MSCVYAVTTALRSQYVSIVYHVQHSTLLLGGMRKRRSNPKSKFMYRHYTQLLAVCPPQMAKANTRSSLANKQTISIPISLFLSHTIGLQLSEGTASLGMDKTPEINNVWKSMAYVLFNMLFAETEKIFDRKSTITNKVINKGPKYQR